MKLTVVGGGNTAFGMAAASSLRDFEVALLEAPEFESSIRPVLEQGGIQIRGVVGEGLAPINLVTTDARAATDGASIVFICVPAYAHARMTDLIAPYLTDQQIVLLMPGNAGGALEFAKRMKEKKPGGHPRLAEASSCLFACKKDGPAGVWVRGLKRRLPVAAFPARESGVQTPALETVIILAGLVSGKDWWAEGRTAAKMGLAGKSADQMIKYVTEGD